MQHAAATAARERLEEALEETSRRLRAVRDRWVPDLEARLAALDLALDEAEREEIVRVRWAKGGHP